MKRLFAGKEILIKIIIDVSIYIFIALLFRILHENTPSADCLGSPLRSLICGRGKGVWGLARYAPEGWVTPIKTSKSKNAGKFQKNCKKRA